MHPDFINSQTSLELLGKDIPGAQDRQQQIRGFDQTLFSQSSILCIGAGGIVSQIAPTLARKGIGAITLLDDDFVEVTNLNRQRFYIQDVGKNKAFALAANLQPECIAGTRIRGIPMRLEEAIAHNMDLSCDAAVCGVDNNPARVASSRYFRALAIPVVFCAVSRDADHGYVFVQESRGSCIGCLFPDIVNDDRFPCPGTPAIADVLQLVGALAVYAVDTLLMNRPRNWNYRRIGLSDSALDGGSLVAARPDCRMFAPHVY